MARDHPAREGVYPAGCFVELSNGSIAQVIEGQNQYKLRPKVLLIMDKDRNLVDNEIINLAESTFNNANNSLSIRAIVHPEDYKIDNKKYYQQGIVSELMEKH